MDVNRTSIDLTLQIDLAQEADFRIGAMQVRPSLREVVLPNETITLEPRVMQVLVALARNPGEVNSKWDLIQSCWYGRAVGDDAIARCIAAVRRLEEAGDIKVTTIPRVGYRLTETKTSPGAPEQAGTSSQADGTGRGPAAIAQRLRRFPAGLAWGAAAALLLLVLGAWWFLSNGNDRSESPLSVAVLPFEANGQDPGDAAYAKSVSAALATRIARPGIELVSTSQSFRFSGTRKQNAYREIPATYIIDGSVRRDHGRLVVNVHFDDRATGEVLFSKSFEGPEAQSLLLSKRVAATMANRIGPLSCIDPTKPNQAREMLGSMEAASNGDMRSSYAQLAKITGESPNRGRLQVLLAQATAGSVQSVPLAERHAHHEAALRQIEKAGRMEPRDSQLFVARYQATPAFDWAGREAVVREGLKLDAGNTSLLFILGFQELQAGYLDKALDHLSAATERDPNSYANFYLALAVMDLLGKRHDALGLIDRREGVPSTPLERNLVAVMKVDLAANGGDYDEALAIYNSPPINLTAKSVIGRMPRLTLIARKTKRSADIAAAMEACSDPGDYPRVVVGPCLPFLAQQGELDLVFAHLDRMIPDLRGATHEQREERWFRSMEPPRTNGAIYELYRPDLRPVRADPRFVELADRLGLIDYWRSKGPPDFCQGEDAPICEKVAAGKS